MPDSGSGRDSRLYIVREIANAHGGAVNGTSGDSATRFKLRLPRISVRKSDSVH